MKQASRIKTKGTVVREVVTPDAVERETEVGAPYEPGEITAAWGMAVKGLYNQVAFGAMLCEMDSCLTRETAQQRNQYSGETLKGWLSENCPTVNYKTAMRWKGMAEAAMELALPEGAGRIGAGEVPALLGMLLPARGENAQRPTSNAQLSTGDGDGENAERRTSNAEHRTPNDEDVKREALERFLEGKSQRDVFAALRGPGRPRGTPSAGRRALTAAEKTDHAWTEIRELLGKVAAYTQGPWIEMLPDDRREWAARTMKDLATCFRDGRPFEASEK